MLIEVLGTGCAKCEALVTRVKSVADRLGVEYELVKIQEIDQIIQRGVMMTPALIVDGELKAMGRVATERELVEMLQPR